MNLQSKIKLKDYGGNFGEETMFKANYVNIINNYLVHDDANFYDTIH